MGTSGGAEAQWLGGGGVRVCLEIIVGERSIYKSVYTYGCGVGSTGCKTSPSCKGQDHTQLRLRSDTACMAHRIVTQSVRSQLSILHV